MPQTCWIAHIKEQLGLPLRHAPNRADPRVRQQPCPPDRRDAIIDALRYFKVI
jgi:hypothetical protein